MAFKASKKRERKPAPPVGRGQAIVPNAAIEGWYRTEMNKLRVSMIEDYTKVIQETTDRPQVDQFFAMDVSVTSIFDTTLRSLQQRWTRIFENFAKKISTNFVDKCESGATDTTLNSLKVAGLTAPTKAYNENIRNTMEASVKFNHTLITNLSEQFHERIHVAVMLSLTSPDPDKQGFKGIRDEIKKAGIECKDRVKLIARDQTSKLYASFSDERMEQNGVEEFEWLHSHAGEVPRKSHLEKDGQIFKLKDPRLWEGKKSDQGPPGWAINCRCRKIPVIR